MANKKVVIVGAGFAGLTCARKLAKIKGLDVLIFDRRSESEFLPLLPDIIGRGLSPAHLRFSLVPLHKGNTRFINRAVDIIDLIHKKVYSNRESFDYDFLLLSTGAETNFYGNDALKEFAFKFSSVNDAVAILEALNAAHFDAVLVVGGGYTGIETVTAIKRHLDENNLQRRIVLIERSGSLLSGFSDSERNYVQRNLARMGIEIKLNCELVDFSPVRIKLNDGKTYGNALLVWSAGVMASTIEIIGQVSRGAQGRIEVDEYLRIDDSAFCCGDMALAKCKHGVLRMGVQFAVTQGELCARSIVNLLENKPLCKYKPLDLGYIVPMANDTACGKVLGVKLNGIFALFLHYCICVYRSFSLKNKIGVIKEAMFK